MEGKSLYSENIIGM